MGTTHVGTVRPSRVRVADLLVRVLSVLTAAGLVVDGVVHLRVAGQYAVPDGGLLAETNLFRAQAVVALLAAAWVLLNPQRWSFAVAGLVAAVAAVAVITTTYFDPGTVGPLPDLYQPTWAVPGKQLSATAEVCSTVLAIVGVCVAHLRERSLTRRAGN